MNIGLNSRVWQSGKVGTLVRLYAQLESDLIFPWCDGYASVRWDSGELSWVESERLCLAILCPECAAWMAAGLDYICPECRLAMP